MTFAEFKKRYQIKLNKQQLDAVQSVNGPILLLAVPGSGKTTVLVNRIEGFIDFVSECTALSTNNKPPVYGIRKRVVFHFIISHTS